MTGSRRKLELLKEQSPTNIKEGSVWFRRFYRDVKRRHPYVRFRRIKMGFYRLYFRQAYLHECYKWMPPIGYDYDDLDPRFESQKYYEEYEDQAELTMKIKNYVEGYADAMKRVETRVYMMKNNAEFYRTSRNAYKQIRIT